MNLPGGMGLERDVTFVSFVLLCLSGCLEGTLDSPAYAAAQEVWQRRHAMFVMRA